MFGLHCGGINPLQYSCLRNPMDRGSGRLQSMGSQESDMTQQLNDHQGLVEEEQSNQVKISQSRTLHSRIGLLHSIGDAHLDLLGKSVAKHSSFIGNFFIPFSFAFLVVFFYTFIEVNWYFKTLHVFNLMSLDIGIHLHCGRFLKRW